MDTNLPQDSNMAPTQPNTQSTNSYVDSYQPPQSSVATPAPASEAPVTEHYQTDFASPSPADVTPAAPSASMPAATPTETPAVTPEPVSATSSTPASATPVSPSTESGSSETLEDQNIFFLLGVEDGTEEEKESFLDELQQVIWEDFLESDVELLITQEELTELKKLMDKTDVSEDQKQEEIITYLEKLIPDLEEIMLEKALQLKEDMVRERIVGMKEYFEGQSEKLSAIDEAESLIQNDKWRQAAEKLNHLLPPAE